MKVLPETVKPLSRTKTFTHDSVPKKLLQNHDTRAGIWAVLNVENGEIQYTIEDNEVVILSKNVPDVFFLALFWNLLYPMSPMKPRRSVSLLEVGLSLYRFE